MTKVPDDTSASSSSTKWNVECSVCSGQMKLKLSTRALHADKSCRRYYWCERCKQSVAADPSGKPISIQADDKTRLERRKAHADIDCYMLITGMTKDQVYDKMAWLLRIKRADLHLGYFSFEFCCRFRTALAEDLRKLCS